MKQWAKATGLGLGALGLVGLLALAAQPLSPVVLDEAYAYQTNQLDGSFQYTTTVPDDQPFAYATQGQEQGPYQYSVMAAPSPDSYTYQANAAPEQSSYTYATMAQSDGPSTYTAQPVADQAYTYNTVQGPDSMTTYTAAPNPPAMTVINGYATDKPQMEEWYTVPMGTLHPTDSAGNANYGAFDSVNLDGTSRSMAPLTLTGERADGTVAQDARGARPMLRSSHLKAARTTQLALVQGAKAAKKVQKVQDLSRVPVAKVADLSPAQRKVWAQQVIQEHKLHKVWETPEAKVKSLTPVEQREWAEHVVAEEKEAPKDRWASKVQEYLRDKEGMRIPVKAGVHRPAKAAAIKLKHFDKFGLPELNGSWSKGWEEAKVQTWKGMTKSLASGRGCGTLCRQRAIASVATSIPIA